MKWVTGAARARFSRRFCAVKAVPPEAGASMTCASTFATMALQNGVDVKTVSSILGHYWQVSHWTLTPTSPPPTPNSKRRKRWGTSSPVPSGCFPQRPASQRLGRKKWHPKMVTYKRKVPEIRRFRGLLVCREGIRNPRLLVRRLFTRKSESFRPDLCCLRCSLGEFSIVYVQPLPAFSDSGSKVGQRRIWNCITCVSVVLSAGMFLNTPF